MIQNLNLTTKYLTHEEEISLLQQYKNNNCLKSAETLVVSNLRYVAKMARLMKNTKVDESDLFQEGTIGLMKAVKTYDLSYKARFITYAIPKIKEQMLNYIINNLSIVKKITSKPHRKLFFNLNKLRNNKETLGQQDIKRIANKLNVSEYDVIDIDNRLNNSEINIDSKIENKDGGLSFHDVLKDPNGASYITVREYDEKFEAINESLELLSERGRYIFLSRNLTDDAITLDVLSKELNISKERIRQIELKSFNKI